MPKEQAAGKPTTRRYSAEEKAAVVRMVRALRAELGVTQGTVQRVATQLGYGVESVRMWVKQVDIDDGVSAGVSSCRGAEDTEWTMLRSWRALSAAGVRFSCTRAGDHHGSFAAGAFSSSAFFDLLGAAIRPHPPARRRHKAPERGDAERNGVRTRYW